MCAGLLLAACGPSSFSNPPPAGAFYFPTGVVHVEAGAGSEGALYVASSNYDRKYDFGSVIGLALDNLVASGGLPTFGAAVPESGPPTLTSLAVGEGALAHIQSFAGEMDKLASGSGARLFVPTRAEGHRVNVLDAPGPTAGAARIGCEAGQECAESGPSLVAFEKDGPDGEPNPSGLPRAPGPSGVGVAPDGQVFISHLLRADSPPGSLRDNRAYLVALDGNHPELSVDSFIELSGGATQAVAVGAHYAYATGRYVDPAASMVRLVSRAAPHKVLFPFIEESFRVLEARGAALSSDEKRLYIVGRRPDTLVVLNVVGDDPPTLKAVRGIPLPDGANQVRVLSRPGRGDLVVVSCSNAGSVVVYDDDVGALVAEVRDVGLSTFGLAVHRRAAADGVGQGARIFATNLGDGQVAVIDIPNLARPHEARLVARLGASHVCRTQPKSERCARAREKGELQ